MNEKLDQVRETSQDKAPSSLRDVYVATRGEESGLAIMMSNPSNKNSHLEPVRLQFFKTVLCPKKKFLQGENREHVWFPFSFVLKNMKNT